METIKLKSGEVVTVTTRAAEKRVAEGVAEYITEKTIELKEEKQVIETKEEKTEVKTKSVPPVRVKKTIKAPK